MGRMQRNKGASYEREAAGEFRAVYPDARRGLGQARSAGEVSDVEGTPWWIECKRGSGSSSSAALKQARLATDGRPALAVIKRDRSEAIVSLYLDDFLKMAAELELLRAQRKLAPPAPTSEHEVIVPKKYEKP